MITQNKNLELLKHSLLHNNPNLFIGAGFSLDAKLKNGQSVLSGQNLKKDIITTLLGYALDSPEYCELSALPLYKLCNHAYIEKGKETIYDYLKTTFHGITPQPFYNAYVSYPWNKIFSTNIDDLIENICQNENIPILVHNEKHNTQAKSNHKIDLYKLHGCVNNADAGFIFDEEEYLTTIVDRSDYRFATLALELQNKDFIFVGSDFDDFNVKYYLNLYASSTDASTSSRGNLFFINPYPSLSFKANIKNVNGILIECTTKEFAEFLNSLEFDQDAINETKLLYNGYIKINQKKLNIPQNSKYNSNLYTGAYPQWEDIFHDWDILLPDVISEFKTQLNKFVLNDNKSFIFAIFGKGYSSKSVVLKRLTQILLNDNYEVISFEGKNFNAQKILTYIQSTTYEKYALVIDDASYLYSEFEYLCKKTPENIKLCIVSTSRQFFHSKRRYALVETNCSEYELSIPINHSLAESVVDKLHDRGYLGLILKDYPDRTSQISYIQSFPDIGSAIFAVTHGKKFKTRFNRDVSEILKNGYHREGLIKLAIFQKLQLPYFPRTLFNQLYKKQSSGFLKRIEDIIRNTSGERIELKNEFIGNLILRNTTPNEILLSLKKLLIAIAPMVENSSNSYWNEIHSVLIKERFAKEYFKIKAKDFKDMLYQIRPYYSENYNYWLQLGIAEQSDGDLDKALIHFNLAQQYGPHSYMVKNAIGRNYLFQSFKEIDTTTAKQLFNEGRNILFELIRHREEYQAKAYSAHTYITGLISFYKKKTKLKISRDEIQEAQELVNSMLKKYKDDPMFISLGQAWTKFLLQHTSAGIKLNLYDLQEKYKSGVINDVHFEDFE